MFVEMMCATFVNELENYVAFFTSISVFLKFNQMGPSKMFRPIERISITRVARVATPPDSINLSREIHNVAH